MFAPILAEVEREYQAHLAKRKSVADHVETGYSISAEKWKLAYDKQGGVMANLVKDGATPENIIEATKTYKDNTAPDKNLITLYAEMRNVMAQGSPEPMTSTQVSEKLENSDIVKESGMRGKIKYAAFAKEAASFTQEGNTAQGLNAIEGLASRLGAKGRFNEIEALAPMAVGLLLQAHQEVRQKTQSKDQAKEAEEGILNTAAMESAVNGGDLSKTITNRLNKNPQMADQKSIYAPLTKAIENNPKAMTGKDFIKAIDKTDIARSLPRQGKIGLAAMRREIAEGHDYTSSNLKMAERIYRQSAETGQNQALAPMIAGMTIHAKNEEVRVNERLAARAATKSSGEAQR